MARVPVATVSAARATATAPVTATAVKPRWPSAPNYGPTRSLRRRPPRRHDMKRILPVEELARDERFERIRIEEVVFDPRNAAEEARFNTLAPSYVNSPDNARGLMHGIFMGEIQALEGAGRTW